MGKKYLVLAVVCIATVASAFAQGQMPEFVFPVFRHPAPGYYLVALNAPTAMTLIDHAGKNVFPVPAVLPANMLITDSTLTYFDEAVQGFVRLNSHFVAIDTLTIGGSYHIDFHEGHVLSNGNYVVLGTETRVMNLSAIVPGGRSQANVIGAVIQERTFSGLTVFEWRSLDHIPVVDATEDIDLTQPTIDYIHVNSVTRENDGNFLVSCRHTDEIIKISRLNGSVIWRMGGQKSRGNQFTFIDDNIDGFVGFTHQHDASRTANGRIILFDNGSLRPNPFSRVAEYEVNEVLKTAKLKWSYRPTPDVFVKHMGSVQELSNGNVLIGFGSESSTMVGQEVSRDGTVQIELQSTGGIAAYRVRKAVFAMSGTERVVSGPGTYTFTHGDSTTHFSTTLTRVDATTSIIAERHSYLPHNVSFVGAEPCVPLEFRWVVRTSQPDNLTGSMRFRTDALGVEVPSLIQLFQRPVEGQGAFSRVIAAYDATTSSILVNTFKSGEFVLAYAPCYNPAPAAPSNNATNVSNTVMMRWTAAVHTGGYDVEVYNGSTISGTRVRSFRTMRIDTAISVPEPGSQYTWRVRAIRPAPNTLGPWSSPFSFRTRLGAAIALSPSSLPDSIAIQQRSTFKWRSVKNASRYRLQVIPMGTSAPALDTIVTDTTCKLAGNLPWNKHMMWSVRGEVDAAAGDWSNTLFIVTPPCPPRLLEPVDEDQSISPESVTCIWAPMEGAKYYHIRMYEGTDGGTPWFEDSTSSQQIDVTGMKSVTVYHWQARTVGRYGAGPWGATQWFMTHGKSVLSVASLLSPVDATGVDTLQATLTWTSVIEASYYHVQLTAKPTFSKPDFQWNSVTTTTIQAPALQAGKVYRWRVMALNDVASGSWSDTASFTTMPGAADALEPLTPIEGSTDVPHRGNVTFLTDKRFNGYRVDFSTSPQFATIDHSSTVTSGVAPYSLQPEVRYWWHAVGLVDGVPVDTGSTSNFTTAKGAVTSVVASTDVTDVLVTLIGSSLTVHGSVEGAAIRVMDIAGRAVHQGATLNSLHSSEDLSHLPVGVYVALIHLADSRVIVYSFVLSDAH